jgi:hypothetical protein
MEALDQLKADEFIHLFLQAGNGSVYKLEEGETDGHTKLLVEIVRNLSQIDVQKDHGELILQALYAAPAVSELAKVLAMASVGATLEYDEFNRRFGKGGDFALGRKKRTYSFYDEQQFVATAFKEGVGQSDDVRFVIDKLKFIEKALTADAVKPFLHSLVRFKFNDESFIQLLEAARDDQKRDLMLFAPRSVVLSDKLFDFVEKGYVSKSSNFWSTLIDAVTLENAVMATKLANFITNDLRDFNGKEQIYRFFAHFKNQQLNEVQSLIISDLKAQVALSELKSEETNIFEFERSAPDYLLRAFETGDLDHFTTVMEKTSQSKQRHHYLMPLFMEVVEQTPHMVVNENHLKMVALLKEAVFAQINDLTSNIPLGPGAGLIERERIQKHHDERLQEHRRQREDDIGPRM